MFNCNRNVRNNVNIVKNCFKRKDQIDFGTKADFENVTILMSRYIMHNFVWPVF